MTPSVAAGASLREVDVNSQLLFNLATGADNLHGISFLEPQAGTRDEGAEKGCGEKIGEMG